ncbi:MAG TPA: thioesterase family protein [Spongiibacteraceae bacterium]|nr:thioesterase family protein [Spongiibacteraceae bacterium]
MRIDRDRIHNGKFPFSYEMQTRFADLDKVGHVNHVNLTAFFQEGRNRFIYAFELMQAAQCGLVVAALNIEFAGDLFHPDPIEIYTGVLEIGRTSFRMAQIAKQNGRIGAYAEVVQVARGESGTMALPDAWRPILERTLI